MPTLVRYALRIGAVIVLLWLVLISGAWLYFRAHRQRLTTQANTFLNARFRGAVHIGRLSLNLWSNFPYPALEADEVTVDDSIYAREGSHTLSLKQVRIVPGWSTLFGRPSVRKVVIRGGSIYLYKNSRGYYNGYVWKNRSPASGRAPSRPLWVDAEGINFSLVDSVGHKAYVFVLHRLSAYREYSDSGTGRWDTYVDMTMGNLSFKTINGGFLQGQTIKGRGTLELAGSALSFSGFAVAIGLQAIRADGYFHFDTSGIFRLRLSAPALAYSAGVSWLPQNLRKVLDSLGLDRPIDAEAWIQGRLNKAGMPRIKVGWRVKKNAFHSTWGSIDSCSFTGYYTNTLRETMPPSDPNSLVEVDRLRGKWAGSVRFQSHRFEILRLDSPVIAFDLTVHGSIAPWQKLLQSRVISLDQGQVDLDLACRYPIKDSSGCPLVTGRIAVHNASITYIPRQVRIENGLVLLTLLGKDIRIDTLAGTLGESRIDVQGLARGFVSLAATDTGNMDLDLRVASEHLDAGDLLPFLGAGPPRPTHTLEPLAPGHLKGPGKLLDQYLERCRMHTVLTVGEVTLRRFTAEGLEATLDYDHKSLHLGPSGLQTAKGSIRFSGDLTPEDGRNDIDLHCAFNRIDLPSLFREFDDFGQESLDADNLRGTLDADARLRLVLTDQGKRVPGSLGGTMAFTIRNGALLNFSPLLKLSVFAFKHRDFSHVYFSQLRDTFAFSHDTLTFHRMDVRSNVLELIVEGLYKIDGQYTDALLQVPFSNLKRKRDTIAVAENTRHGLSLYIRASAEGAEPLRYRYSVFKPRKAPGSPVIKK